MGGSPDDTNHLTQPHSMGSNTACWFIGKYGLSNAISEDPNEMPEFIGISLSSAMFAFLNMI